MTDENNSVTDTSLTNNGSMFNFSNQEEKKDSGNIPEDNKDSGNIPEDNKDLNTESDSTNESSDKEKETPKWKLDDNTELDGERPDWLPEKFKTASALGKAYNELQTRFGETPNEYDLSSSKYIEPDAEQFKDFSTFAKSKGVSQDVVNKMVESFDSYLDSFSFDYEAEKEKLGPDYKDQIEILDNWSKGNLSNDSYEALKFSIKTSEGIKALQELRSVAMSNDVNVPSGNDSSSQSSETSSSISQEITNNASKYTSDQGYRQATRARLEKALQKEGKM